MKKVLIVLISLLLLTGCGWDKKISAKDTVINYLEKYRTQDEDVVKSLDDYLENQTEVPDQYRDKYKEVLLKQYKNIQYKINNEVYDDDEATISVKITVFDLYKAQIEAHEYLRENLLEFNDESGAYDKDLFTAYKLDLMNRYTNTVDYNIDFHLTKNDKKEWKLEPLSEEDLEKIHGIYQYKN